jgi:hypothetical protein
MDQRKRWQHDDDDARRVMAFVPSPDTPRAMRTGLKATRTAVSVDSTEHRVAKGLSSVLGGVGKLPAEESS